MQSPSSNLLDLQELDTKIEQNKYEVENFPELKELDESQVAQKGLLQKREKVQVELSEITKKQKRLEDEVASIDDKKKAYQLQLEESGSASPKDLQNLEKAVEGQKLQQDKLEEEILIQMEEAEPLEARFQELQSETEEMETKISLLHKKIDSITADTNQKLSILINKKEKLRKDIPAEVLETYEKLITHHLGIAVAELRGDKCHGCDLNMTHSSSEIERLHNISDNELAHCSECQRILIIK